MASRNRSGPSGAAAAAQRRCAQPLLMRAVTATTLLAMAVVLALGASCGAAPMGPAATMTRTEAAATMTATEPVQGRGPRPYFCMGLDCPDFDVLETSGDVQLRRYRSARYVATHVDAGSLLEAQIEGTKRLLAYLAGANEDDAKLLPPTVPLETILFPADPAARTVEGRFCVVLYLPECAQDDPPRPSDRRVRIVHARTTDWFVLRVRTSFIDEAGVIRRTWEFIRDLEDTRGRCAVDRRVASFGVYQLPLPFVKPGYFEIAVPRRRRGDCGDGPAALRDGPAPPVPGGGGGDEDTGVAVCEVCGDCEEPSPAVAAS